MIQRVLKVGFLAGLVVGLAIAVLQHFTTSQLILKGEVYEKAAEHQHHAAVSTFPEPHLSRSAIFPDARSAIRDPGRLEVALDPGSPSASGDVERSRLAILLIHDDGANATTELKEDGGWQPANGWQRVAATSVATVATSIGYALILLAAMLAAGIAIVPRAAVLWGIAAFAATSLAPALGLSPELPGSAAAPLMARQVWWVATALCTGGGLYLLAQVEQRAAKMIGIALIALPHLIGAPQTAAFKSTAPAELAAQFAATSLVLSAVLWVLLGLAIGYGWQRASLQQRGALAA
ncbi:MAG: hypothetical protein NVSMB26_27750 [Beijerinckiaceae bacterium]